MNRPVVYIKKEQYRDAGDLLKTNETPLMCLQWIRNKIGDSPVVIMLNGKIYDLPLEKQIEFKIHWIPFIKDCVTEIAHCGFVPVSYKLVEADPSSKDEFIIIPYVISGTLGTDYDIRVVSDPTKLGTISLHFYRKIDSNGSAIVHPVEDEDVDIFYDFDYNPTAEGDLRSIATCIFRNETVMRMFEQLGMSAEKAHSESAAFLESTETVPKSIPTAGTYIQPADSQKANLAQAYSLNEQEIVKLMKASMQASLEYAKEIRTEKDVKKGDRPFDSTFYGELAESLLRGHTNKLVPIPPGRKITTGNVPDGIRDWASKCDTYAKRVCSAFCIPYVAMFPTTSSKAVKDESQTITSDIMSSTIESWKRRIEKILYRCWNVAHYKGAIQALVDNERKIERPEKPQQTNDVFLRQEEDNKSSSSEYDNKLNRILKKNGYGAFTVSYELMPKVTQDELFMMYSVGTIAKDTFDSLLLSMKGLSQLFSNDKRSGREDPLDIPFKLEIAKKYFQATFNKLGDWGTFAGADLRALVADITKYLKEKEEKTTVVEPSTTKKRKLEEE